MAETFTPDNVLLRDQMLGKVPGTQTQIIMETVMSNSRIMQLGKYEDMRDAQGRPVTKKDFTFLADGIGAYWVDEGEIIQTSKPTWVPATMTAKKLGVILVVSREFLYYTVSDFFEAIKPEIAKAFYTKFDDAGILGVDNPFAQSVDKSATDASNTVAGPISYESVLGLEDAVLAKGFTPNAFITKTQNATALRGATATENGVVQSIYDRQTNSIDGLPTVSMLPGSAMPTGTLYTGDFNHLHYGIPYNITYEVSTSAQLSSIVGSDSKPINLFERELLALRATMDVAFMITKDDAFARLGDAPAAGGEDAPGV